MPEPMLIAKASALGIADWIERVILTIVFVTPIAYLIL
jgi:hypothetical protein